MRTSKLKKSKVIRKPDQKVIVESCYVAKSFLDRLVGLMGKEDLQRHEGLWISPCNSIHTFFMKVEIDAVFLDSEGKVLRIYQNLKPWRMTSIVPGAHGVLEVPSGIAAHLKKGETLCLS